LPEDKTEALKWFCLAAAKNDPQAQYNLGLMSYQGNGVAQDYEEAHKWFRLAAVKGHREAQYYLGYIYLNGDVGPIDKRKAIKWFRLALPSKAILTPKIVLTLY
jgi:TPR repeat protein